MRLYVGGKDKKTVFSIPGRGVFGTSRHVPRLVGCKLSATVCACCMRACVCLCLHRPSTGPQWAAEHRGVEPVPRSPRQVWWVRLLVQVRDLPVSRPGVIHSD